MIHPNLRQQSQPGLDAHLESSSYGSVIPLTIWLLLHTIATSTEFLNPYVPSNYSPRTAAEMIKQDLIQRVVERTGLPRTKAESAVDAIFESMKQTLIAGDRIELRGFGVFTVKPRKTGIGRNPRTGAEVTIAPGKAVRFKPGKELHLLQ
jgi:DNA-binding protein HU-beta